MSYIISIHINGDIPEEYDKYRIISDNYTGSVFPAHVYVDNTEVSMDSTKRLINTSGMTITSSNEIKLVFSEPLTTAYYLFYEMNGLKSVDWSQCDTSSITSFRGTFSNCIFIGSVNFTGIDTSSVTDMSNMFSNCNFLPSLDLSSFDTSNVVNMNGMFNECYELTSLNLYNFDTALVENFNHMFYACVELTSINLGHFTQMEGEDMDAMFDECDNINLYFIIDRTTDIEDLIKEASSSASYDPTMVNATTTTERSINLSNLSGWTSLASGNHTIDIRPKVGSHIGPVSKNTITVYKR